jgi:hypothetical protein
MGLDSELPTRRNRTLRRHGAQPGSAGFSADEPEEAPEYPGWEFIAASLRGMKYGPRIDRLLVVPLAVNEMKGLNRLLV